LANPHLRHLDLHRILPRIGGAVAQQRRGAAVVGPGLLQQVDDATGNPGLPGDEVGPEARGQDGQQPQALLQVLVRRLRCLPYSYVFGQGSPLRPQRLAAILPLFMRFARPDPGATGPS
jgi:hypothetical protein